MTLLNFLKKNPHKQKITDQHERKYHSLLVKYKNRVYKIGSYREGSNMGFNLKTCEDKKLLRQCSNVTY